MDSPTGPPTLSPRELEIAQAYSGGASYRQVAEQLFIAPTTVRTHIQTIYRKLGVSTKLGLLRVLETQDAVNSAGALAVQAGPGPGEELRHTWPHGPSVAVLPLDHGGGDPADTWFAEGLTKDITFNLSRFRNLCVISHNSASLFNGTAVPSKQAATELGVQYIAEGRVHREGKQIRLGIELIDAKSGRTVWGERYDREVDRIFAVQDDITEMIVAALAVQIDSTEIQRISDLSPTNLTAYDYVLQGQQRAQNFTYADNLAAQNLFQKALEADDKYARAYAALAHALSVSWHYGLAEVSDDVLDTALDFARQAVKLDPSDGRGFGAMGFVHLDRKEHDLAIKAYERSLSLNSNDVDTLAGMADVLSHVGQSEQALALVRRAMRLNPLCPDKYLWALGTAYYNLKRYEEAIEALLQMHDPSEGRRLLAASYAQLGKMDRAQEQAAQILEANPEFSADQWAAVVADKYEEELQHFVEGLKKAGL